MSNALIAEDPLLVLPTLAEEIGLNEAILLQQIHFWLNVKSKEGNKQYYRKGSWWVYNSAEEWKDQFPFWSTDTIRRILKRLSEEGYVYRKQLAEDPMDRTYWYTIRYENLPKLTLKNGTTQSAELQDRNLGKSAPAYNTGARSETNKTENTTTAAPADAPPPAHEEAPDPFTVKENDVDAITAEAFGTPIRGLSIKDQIEQKCEDNAPEGWDCLRAVCQTIIDKGWSPSAALVKTRLEQQIQMINETHDEEEQDDFAAKAQSIFEAAGRGAGVHE